MNPSQIAIISEIIRKSESIDLKEEKNNIIQSGEKATLEILEEKGLLSAKELADQTGRSLSSTKRYLSSLIEKGQVETIGNKARLKYYKVERKTTDALRGKMRNE